ncbi:MAG: RDD family protein [Gammaproteobacteria bacterium]|nr:RDD family protein [Gammaproteobacteria bacterium]
MENNPYASPKADLGESQPDSAYQYVGFWSRVGASIIDTILMMLVIGPVLTALYGQEYWLAGVPEDTSAIWDILLNWLFPAFAVLAFWFYRSATPGKMAIKAKIIDAKTGGKPSIGQLILRYIGYWPSMLVFFLGIIWVAFDQRKQGWHDKIAGTLVVRK